MTTDAHDSVRLAPAVTPSGRGPRPTPPWPLLAAAVVAVGFVATGAYRQALEPYVRRDDWPYLLPPHTPGAADVHAKNLLEGRWLNDAWWALIGQHSTPVSAALTYAVVYAVFVVGLWRVLRLSVVRAPWHVDALLGLALYASGVWVQLLYWPGTIIASTVVGTVAIWTLPLTGRSHRRLAAWLVVATILTVLSYPPVGAVLFLAAVVWLRKAPVRRILLLGGLYLAAFGLGVAIMYTLNWISFGHFGLEIAAWRHPNPLTSPHDLLVNAARFKRAMLRVADALWPAVVVGGVAVVVGWFDAAVRPRLVRLLLGVAVVVGLQSLQTLATGVVTDDRGQLWAWLAAVVAAALLLRSRARTARWWTGVAGLGVLAAFGVLTWRSDIALHQDTRARYAAIAAEATRPQPDGSRRPVVIYVPPGQWATSKGGIMAGYLRMVVRAAADGAAPRWCRGSECTQLAALPPGRFVADLGPVVGVVAPPPPSVL